MVKQPVSAGGSGSGAQGVIVLQGSATGDDALLCVNTGFTQDDFDRVSTVCIRQADTRSISVMAGSGGGSGGGGTTTKLPIEYLFSDREQNVSLVSTGVRDGDFVGDYLIGDIKADALDVSVLIDVPKSMKLSGKYDVLLWLYK